MTGRLTNLLAVGSLCIAVASSTACEIRVRDSAFRTIRDIHRLCVVADSTDDSAAAIVTRLTQWLDSTDDAFNLEVVRVDADDPETNWRAFGIPSRPPTVPVTVLVGRNHAIGESFLINHWDPAPTTDQLEEILDSPARQRLARELARNLAVLVYAPHEPANDSALTSELESIIDAGITDERIGLSLLALDRTDRSEQLLCRFMGLRPNDPDTLYVAFGRGKLMFPPLVGDDINAANIDQLVTEIRQACSCSKPLPTMGVDIPLVWSDEVDSTVILMDQELDLDNLDAEVQSMLATKASGVASAETKTVSIPPGRQTATPDADSAAVSARSAATIVGIVLTCAGSFAFILLRRRLSQINSRI